MRVNGYLQCLVQNESGVNEWGETVAGEAEWSELAPCSIRTITDDRTASYDDGTYHRASYNVLVDIPSLRALYDVLRYHPRRIVRARVFLRSADIALGDYTIQSVEYISTSNRLQVVLS